jgi:hypothetical protein
MAAPRNPSGRGVQIIRRGIPNVVGAQRGRFGPGGGAVGPSANANLPTLPPAMPTSLVDTPSLGRGGLVDYAPSTQNLSDFEKANSFLKEGPGTLYLKDISPGGRYVVKSEGEAFPFSIFDKVEGGFQRSVGGGDLVGDVFPTIEAAVKNLVNPPPKLESVQPKPRPPMGPAQYQDMLDIKEFLDSYPVQADWDGVALRVVKNGQLIEVPTDESFSNWFYNIYPEFRGRGQ